MMYGSGQTSCGLYSVKRTVLFDGRIPVYHLYHGSKNDDASTIITTFPFKKPGISGRRGSNQTRAILQAIPVGAADFRVDRLNLMGIAAAKGSRFGLTGVMFAHPCGIPMELVENAGDSRPPIVNDAAGITAAHGIRGIFGATVAVTDATAMDEFIEGALEFACAAKSDEGSMWIVPEMNGLCSVIEVVTDRDSPQGTWTLAGGTVPSGVQPHG